MRIAYIGLSTPTFYDYKTPATRTVADTNSSPNPILESPFGLLLLYDELWFLCRSLCPENMRTLSYVRYLDEEKLLPDIEDVIYSDIATLEPKRIEQLKQAISNNFSLYDDIKQKIGINWDSAPDNHTHELLISRRLVSGNSVKLENLIFDMEMVRRLSTDHHQHTIELITNSFTQPALETPNSPYFKSHFTEMLLIENIPNYLTRIGPYHPCIEDVRNNPYLQHFRKWVIEKNIPTEPKEMIRMKKEVEDAIQEAQERVFLKQFKPNIFYQSIGKTILGAGVDFLLPAVSTVASIAQDGLEYWRTRNHRWQAFLVSAKKVNEELQKKYHN